MLFKGAQHFPYPLARHAEGLSNLSALDQGALDRDGGITIRFTDNGVVVCFVFASPIIHKFPFFCAFRMGFNLSIPLKSRS